MARRQHGAAATSHPLGRDRDRLDANPIGGCPLHRSPRRTPRSDNHGDDGRNEKVRPHAEQAADRVSEGDARHRARRGVAGRDRGNRLGADRLGQPPGSANVRAPSVSSSGAGANAAHTHAGAIDLAHQAIRQRADALSVDYTSSFCDRIPPDADANVRLFRCHVADQSAGDGDFKATGFGAVPGTTCIVAVHVDRRTEVSDCE
jgi:hypothetical protein